MEAIGRLAGGIAHDFNNLLTPIIGYSELVMSTLADGDPRRQDLDEIGHAAHSASALTRRLLTFSRKQMTEPVVLDLNEVLADVQKLVQRAIGEDVNVTVSCAPNLGHIRADRTQIEQIVMNLSVNARDAMPGGGRLLNIIMPKTDGLTLAYEMTDKRPATRVLFHVRLHGGRHGAPRDAAKTDEVASEAVHACVAHPNGAAGARCASVRV